MVDNKKMIHEFVHAHRCTYFLYDFLRSPKYRELFDEYVLKFVSALGGVEKVLQKTPSWGGADGKITPENVFKDTFVEKKESDAGIHDAFDKVFAGTDVKFEDCVKYANEEYAKLWLDNLTCRCNSLKSGKHTS